MNFNFIKVIFVFVVFMIVCSKDAESRVVDRHRCRYDCVSYCQTRGMSDGYCGHSACLCRNSIEP